jgi:hypothetical protein
MVSDTWVRAVFYGSGASELDLDEFADDGTELNLGTSGVWPTARDNARNKKGAKSIPFSFELSSVQTGRYVTAISALGVTSTVCQVSF